MNASGLYVGSVVHRRTADVAHAFRRRVTYCWLDHDELDTVFAGRWLWSTRRPAPYRFRRRDHFGPPTQPLADAVRDEVGRRLGRRPQGPVRTLTLLRCWGVLFNPVTFHYCYERDAAGERLQAVLAEITNTPWLQRHVQVVGRAAGEDPTAPLRATFGKQFHVSPFLPMALDYEWTFAVPGERLRVQMTDHGRDGPVFAASLDLQRQPLCGRTLAAAALRQPWPTLGVTAAIYWHALRLWWKGARFHPHPQRSPS